MTATTLTATPVRRRRATRVVALGATAVLAMLALTSCLGTPASTDKIALLDTRVVGDWTYQYFRNTAYPCAIKGYQTFVIGTRTGSSPTDTRPLWVKMHGGGVGWFAADGSPQPTAGQKSEESFDALLGDVTPGVMADVMAAPEGFRLTIVSMCSHDLYAGNNNPDPNNPNTTPDGKPRPTTGLVATKAAIQYTTAHYPTDDYFLHGTSAGGAGTFNVAWAMQQQGRPPTGIVSDSGVVNLAWEQYVADHGIDNTPGCSKATDDRANGVAARIDPELANPSNQPHLLVSRGALTVPILHVWNHHDVNSCGDVPIPCPLPDGSTPTMSAGDCRHEPLRLAIDAQGAGSRSANLAVCVEGNDTTMTCDRHVVTGGPHLTNSDPNVPADFQAVILDWVHARLADD